MTGVCRCQRRPKEDIAYYTRFATDMTIVGERRLFVFSMQVELMACENRSTTNVAPIGYNVGVGGQVSCKSTH